MPSRGEGELEEIHRLTTRFQTTGNLDDLEAAIVLAERNAASSPPGSFEWRLFADAGAYGRLQRYQVAPATYRDDLDRALAAFEAIVQSLDRGERDFLIAAANIALAWMLRYERDGNFADLDATIAAYETSFELREMDPTVPVRILNYANALLARYERFARREDALEAITAARYLIEIREWVPQERLTNLLTRLAAAVAAHAPDANDLDLVAEAETVIHERGLGAPRPVQAAMLLAAAQLSFARFALGDVPAGETAREILTVLIESAVVPPDIRTEAKLRMAVAHTKHGRSEQRRADLDAAVALARDVHDARESRPEDRQRATEVLAYAYWQRYDLARDVNDLDASIHAYESRPDLFAQQPVRRSILAQLYLGRYRVSRVAADLDHGLRLSRAVQDEVPEDARHDAKSILSDLLQEAFELRGDGEDLDAAISLLEECVALAATPETRAGDLRRLAVAFIDRFDAMRSASDAASAVAACTAAAALAPEDVRPAHLSAHATALYSERRVTGGRVDEAFELLRNAAATFGGNDRAEVLLALASLLKTHADAGHGALLGELFPLFEEAAESATERSTKADVHAKWSDALYIRYEAEGRPEDIDAMVREAEQALALADDEDRDRFEAQLATALVVRGQFRGAGDDIFRAVELSRRGVARGRRGADQLLARVLSASFDRTGEVATIDEAIGAGERAVQRARSADELRGAEQNLAFMLFSRYRHSRGRADLDRAIDVCRSALTRDPTDRNARADILGNLSTNLRLRFEVAGDPADLESAIDALHEALAIRGPRSSDFPLWSNQLAMALQARFRAFGRFADLDEAIDTLRAALRWGRSLHERLLRDNLAVALSRRKAAGDLDEAVALNEETARALPAGSLDWVIAQTNLAVFRASRFEAHANPDDLRAAIAAARAAYEAAPPGSSPGVNARRYYGALLVERFKLSVDPSDLDEAIAAHEEAIASGVADQLEEIAWRTTVGAAYQERHRRTGDAADLTQGARHHREAVIIASRGLWRFPAIQAGIAAAGFFLRAGELAEAAASISPAIEAANENYRVQLSAADASRALDDAATVYMLGASVFLANGDAGRALVTLEQGRAQGLRSKLSRDFADLDALERQEPERVANYRAAAARLRALDESPASAVDPAAHRQSVTEARDSFDAAVEAIRDVAGFERFLADPTLQDIGAAATVDVPLVYVVLHGMLNVAVIVSPAETKGGTIAVETLAPFSRERFERIVGGFAATATPDEGRRAVAEWIAAATEVMQRIAPHLHASRVAIVPCGLASYLPLHAPLIDGVAVSYAPSAAALRTARRLAAAHAAASPRLAGVAGSDEGPSALPFAAPELRAIRHAVPAHDEALLFGDAATKERLYNALEDATHLHVATHATFNTASVLASSIAVEDGLRLREIIANRARFGGVRLAVLSACRTALTDLAHQPDEATGFPTGLLQAGVPGVVGSLWQVPDLSTALLMLRFYEIHTKAGTAARCGELADPAVALAAAQRWLRDASPAELIGQIERLGAAARTTRALAALAALPPTARPFSHPHYWAPFVFYGA